MAAPDSGNAELHVAAGVLVNDQGLVLIARRPEGKHMAGGWEFPGGKVDIGIGNALDKFARSKDLPHPGGPMIETQAKLGKYEIELPYTVKGMDLAFSGLVSAAKDSKAALPDVCYSLQETAFAMCVEVTERAMSLAGKNEVLLVGGVGANRRLQEMVRVMCDGSVGLSSSFPNRNISGITGL